MLNFIEFMYGAAVTASAIVGVLFLRYWKRTRDPIFVFFATAFWMLGLNWLLLAFTSRQEPQTNLYIIRIAAFGLIIVGILHKNMRLKGR